MEKDSEDLVASITPDVMQSLVRSQFFQKLDDLLSPADPSKACEACKGGFELSESILQNSGFDFTEIEDIFAVLRTQGGSCDCEILYNVSDTNRLKTRYWQTRAKELNRQQGHARHSSHRE